jgi:hypothetical protein
LKKNFLFLFLLTLSQLVLAQTYHLGVSGGVNSTYFLNRDITYGASDTDYVITAGYQFSAFSSVFFDNGGYYSKRLYGIKAGIEYAFHNQTFDVFNPSLGPGIPREFYRYKLKLTFIDFPLLFNCASSHHQGFYGEIGPVLSFQQSQSYQMIENKTTENITPDLSKYEFEAITLNLVLGLGIMVNQTEKLAFFGSLRFGHSLFPNALQISGPRSTVSHYRAWGGIIFGGVYKINKYDAKKRKRIRKFKGEVA